MSAAPNGTQQLPRRSVRVSRPGLAAANFGRRRIRVLNLLTAPIPPPDTDPNGSELDYGRLGSLVARLAGTAGEVARAQRLRYRVFYEEMGAFPTAEVRWRRRDMDQFDSLCDHLLVLDQTDRNRSAIAGTYRLMRLAVARQRQIELYTQSEFDLGPLLARHPTLSFMELGRSCVAAQYRNRRTLELLWHGLWTYVRQHGVDVMVGCASFPGTNPQAHALALRYLRRHHLAPPEWLVVAHPNNRAPAVAEPSDTSEPVDVRAALRHMPPLIKGYLRLGAYVGDGAVLDHQFRTTDVCIVLPVARIDPRYFVHFGSPDEQVSRLATNGPLTSLS